MALELQLIKHHSGILIPATPETKKRGYPVIKNPARRYSVAEFRRVMKPGISPALFRASISVLNTGNQLVGLFE